MGEPAQLRLKVRYYEVDEYGHVNHANYVHYLEVARIEALEAVGLPLGEMRRQGYLLVAADLSVKYHSPARTGDALEIVTRISEVRGARSVWIQEVREAVSQRLVVTATVTGAFMTEDGRAVRTPMAFREKLSALYVSDAASADAGFPPGEGGETATLRHGIQWHGRDPLSRKGRPWCLCDGGGLRKRLRKLAGLNR